MIGEIRTLHPAFRLAVDRILHGMRAKGWDPIIASGMRTHEQQDALFAQGRRDLGHVNSLRKRAGLPPISAAANVHTVTKAKGGQSNHNLTQALLAHGRSAVDVVNGFAVDIVDRRCGWDIPHKEFWRDLGELAKKNGCAWGGDWRTPDPAHVEMKVVDSAPRTSVVV
jgi:peptidoglycan L-alanyl-D-glutamate endopeptidase CwlK